MRYLTYKVLDFFYENDRARKMWLFVAWAGLVFCTLGMEWWRAGLVMLFGLLIHWHGLVDGAKNVEENT